VSQISSASPCPKCAGTRFIGSSGVASAIGPKRPSRATINEVLDGRSCPPRSAVLLAAISGCYLSHERIEPPPPIERPPCAPRTLEPLYVLDTTIVGGGRPALTVATDGCDRTALAWNAPLAVATSRVMPPVLDPPVPLDEAGAGAVDPAMIFGPDGRLHVLARSGDALVRFATEAGDGPTFGPPDPLPTRGPGPALSRGPYPRPRHFAATHEDGRLVVAWIEDLGDGGRRIVVATESASDDFPPGLRVELDAGPGSDQPREPRLCVGGGRTVVAWERARPDETTALLAFADDGGPFSTRTLGPGAGSHATGSGVDVACLPDGSALVAWAEPGALAVARLTGSGVLSRTAHVTGAGLTLVSTYPHLDLSSERALVSVQALGSFTVAWLALDGTLEASLGRVDLDGDGAPDTRDETCTVPGLGRALALGAVQAGSGPTRTFARALDGDLLPNPPIELPSIAVLGPSAVACTAHGTAMRLRDGLLAIVTP
jgi:hypothetical protein